MLNRKFAGWWKYLENVGLNDFPLMGQGLLPSSRPPSLFRHCSQPRRSGVTLSPSRQGPLQSIPPDHRSLQNRGSHWPLCSPTAPNCGERAPTLWLCSASGRWWPSLTSLFRESLLKLLPHAFQVGEYHHPLPLSFPTKRREKSLLYQHPSQDSPRLSHLIQEADYSSGARPWERGRGVIWPKKLTSHLTSTPTLKKCLGPSIISNIFQAWVTQKDDSVT